MDIGVTIVLKSNTKGDVDMMPSSVNSLCTSVLRNDGNVLLFGKNFCEKGVEVCRIQH